MWIWKCIPSQSRPQPVNHYIKAFHLPRHLSLFYTPIDAHKQTNSAILHIYLPPYTMASPEATVFVSHHAASSVDSIADYNRFNTVVCRAARIRCIHGVAFLSSNL